jgi:hypothetical protein
VQLGSWGTFPLPCSNCLDSSDILPGGIQVAANGASKAREGKLTS